MDRRSFNQNQLSLASAWRRLDPLLCGSSQVSEECDFNKDWVKLLKLKGEEAEEERGHSFWRAAGIFLGVLGGVRCGKRAVKRWESNEPTELCPFLTPSFWVFVPS